MTDDWYALHVRSRFEKHVRTQLEKKGYETLLPSYTSVRRWSDRVKSISLPLFPNYLFCRFDINERLPILVTPGVKCIVGAGKSPVAVDPAEIDAIRRVLDSGLPAQPWPFLAEGMRVRVTNGPLENLEGVIVREKGSDRLVVSVHLLMRSVSVEIDRGSVAPLNDFAFQRIERVASA